MPFSMFSAALVAALVGFGSTIALVLSAASALGATSEQTASWFLAVCMATGIGSAFLSFRTKIPCVLAWSTPGAALIAATHGISLPEGVGAFILAGLLIALTGALRPLSRAIGLIPDGIAGAMLAGVLFPLCVKLSGLAHDTPKIVLPMLAVFVLVRLKNPSVAVLCALATGVGVAMFTQAGPELKLHLAVPKLVFLWPELRMDVLLGLGIPLYLVTMASQNLPGFATIRAAGYTPPVRAALGLTGVLSTVAALFGAHTVNMAAITAAICLADDTHPDPKQRWKVGVVYGVIWAALGLLGLTILQFLAAMPPAMLLALVAIALLGPLTGALSGAFSAQKTRFAATATFVVAASGVAFFGIGAAFWGLLAGLTVYFLETAWQKYA